MISTASRILMAISLLRRYGPAQTAVATTLVSGWNVTQSMVGTTLGTSWACPAAFHFSPPFWRAQGGPRRSALRSRRTTW